MSEIRHPMDEPEQHEDDEWSPDTLITCWCGAQGTVDELFDFSDAEGGCGGTGTIQCHCGGDFCVCHHHGEYECPGCEDCDGDDLDDNWGGDYHDDY